MLEFFKKILPESTFGRSHRYVCSENGGDLENREVSCLLGTEFCWIIYQLNNMIDKDAEFPVNCQARLYEYIWIYTYVYLYPLYILLIN